MSEISPEEAGWTFELMLKYLNAAEQAEVLHGLRAGMPPAVFDEWIEALGRSLPPDAFASLGRLLDRRSAA
jgi:hypothetical protein